ncbi:MAG: hypothetical protein VB858_02555, partial [Planctomycetaceae bacterium]
TTRLILKGGNLTGATDFWGSFGGSWKLAGDVKDNGSNAAEVTWDVSLPADSPIGIHGIRVATPGGVSALKLVLVDDLPSIAQAGGNTKLESAQEVTVPVAIDGTVQNLQVNYYRFQAEAGRKISIEAVARRLGSALDPIVRLLDSKGRELAWSDDEAGLRSDSRLCYTIKAAGQYIVEVRDIAYKGGGGHFYRLRIGDFPCISAPYPMAVQRGAGGDLAFIGKDTQGVAAVKFNPTTPLNWASVSARREGGQSSGFTLTRISDAAQDLEAEPNNELAGATRIELGHGINGRIDQAGDIDHFIFAAKKGQKMRFKAITRRQGSPCSVYMRLLNATGGQVAAKEDFGVGDAAFDYTFPADGDFVLSVEELHGNGGPEYSYHVDVSPPRTGFSLTAANTLNVGAGATSLVSVGVVRSGYTGPIQIAAIDLPDGVSSNPTIAGNGQNSVMLSVTSTADAPLNRAVPIRITGTARIGDVEFQTVADTEGAMKAAYNALPWGPQILSQHVALGIGPRPQIRLRTETSEVVFGKSLTGSLKVIAERSEGFNEAITLVVTPDAKKGGLPGNITAALKPIPKDQTEVVITFSANDKAALGQFSVALNGTIKQGKTTVTQAAPGVILNLQNPLTLTATPASEKLAAGGEVNIKVAVERNPALTGEVVLTFANLPKGVTVEAAKIPADKNEVEVTLKAAGDAARGAAGKLTVKGEVTVGKVKLAGTSAVIALTVE